MNLLRRLLPGIALVMGAFLLSVGLQTLAFTEPSAGPTGGTVYAPVNTSGTAQTKSGNFTSSGTLIGNIVSGISQMCLGGSCISSWGGAGDAGLQRRVSSTACSGANLSIKTINADGTVSCETDDGGAGGSGTVTSVGSGTGLTGGPITISGTLSADTNYLQRRVSSVACSGANLSIKTINADGTVSCETDDGGGGGGITSINGMGGPAISVAGSSDIGISNGGNTVTIINNGITGVWPAGGSGLNGGGTSGDVMLSLAQSCPAGQFLSGVGTSYQCASPAPSGGGPTIVQRFMVWNAGGGVNQWLNIPGNWAFCMLSGHNIQETSGSTNQFCYVDGIRNGAWTLSTYAGNNEDVTCDVQCVRW